MISPPPCMALGSHCRELRLTLRVAELTDDGPEFHDAIATWLLGHGERITFGKPYAGGSRLLVDATIHVPCKYLEIDDEHHSGRRRQRAAGDKAEMGTCAAHGMRGRVPPSTLRARPVALRDHEGTFRIVQDRKVQMIALGTAAPVRRSLPTVQAENPCAGAPCRTGDNRRGAACCRDMTIEVVLPESEVETEALLRARTSPYLCKVSRTDEDVVECEIISACGHLGSDDLSCTLHGLVRPNGSPAKPSICSEWPSAEPGSTYHPGCRFIPEDRAVLAP